MMGNASWSGNHTRLLLSAPLHQCGSADILWTYLKVTCSAGRSGPAGDKDSCGSYIE